MDAYSDAIDAISDSAVNRSIMTRLQKRSNQQTLVNNRMCTPNRIGCKTVNPQYLKYHNNWNNPYSHRFQFSHRNPLFSQQNQKWRHVVAEWLRNHNDSVISDLGQQVDSERGHNNSSSTYAKLWLSY